MKCGHKCGQECSVRPCRCTSCPSQGSSPPPSEWARRQSSSAPRRRGEIPQTEEGRAFREFANGGHIEEAARLKEMSQRAYEERMAKLALRVERTEINDEESLIEFGNGEDEETTQEVQTIQPWGNDNQSPRRPGGVELLIDIGEEQTETADLSESTSRGGRYYNPGPSGTSIERTSDGRFKTRQVYTTF